MKALILGCGYLGRRVASRWIEAGHKVAALTRSSEKAQELRDAGVVPIIGDVTNLASLAALPTADVVLYAVGYDRASGVDRRTVVQDGLRHALESLAGKTGRLVDISTTSVYGQSQGEWIDEDSPTTPTSEAGRIALDAEQLLTTFSRDQRERSGWSRLNSVILRLSGLYGPGRLLRRVEQLRAGEPIAGDGEAWLNLIHVDDAATAVVLAAGHDQEHGELRRSLSSEDEGGKRRMFLVSDDRPVRRRDYYSRLAELTGSPPPVFDTSAATRSAGLGKRCRNDRVKQELGLSLRFPTFLEGLADALDTEGSSGLCLNSPKIVGGGA